MYDTLRINKKWIDGLIEHRFSLQDNKYYSFQTKSLDCALLEYIIEEDGSFVWEHQEYQFSKTEKSAFNIPVMSPVGEVKYIPQKYNTYIEFYYYFITEDNKEEHFVTFNATILDGVLNEINVHSIEKYDLEERKRIKERNKKYWDKVHSSFYWQLSMGMVYLKRVVLSMLHPFTNAYSRLEEYLTNKAKNNALK